MEKFKIKDVKKHKSHKNVWLTILTIVFIVLGTACVIVGSYYDIVKWLQTCGVAFFIAAVPLGLALINYIVKNEIGKM